MLIILIIGFFFGFYASFVEPFRLRVANWSVETEKWTNSKELKIAILTDLHMIWPWMTPRHLEAIVEETNKLHPDVVLLLGDYVGTHPFGTRIDPDSGLAPLAKLSPSCGVYAVAGNHDAHSHGHGDWLSALERTKIPLLKNQALSIKCKDQQFWIAGLEELWWQHTDIGKTMTQVTNSDPVIMMMHNPDSFPDIPERVALSVAGHTHGGQVRLPFIGAIAAVVPSKFGTRYVYGHINENGKDLVVSSGLGMTALPIRFLNPPEICFITLKGASYRE